MVILMYICTAWLELDCLDLDKSNPPYCLPWIKIKATHHHHYSVMDMDAQPTRDVAA